ncbi:hypothetical protein SRCM100169_01447 [Bacillus siamensis]|nr:hypothetical protein SRCM100169_01447 [Bacillus siamensis]
MEQHFKAVGIFADDIPADGNQDRLGLTPDYGKETK